MKMLSVHHDLVEIEDAVGYRSSIFLGGDGRWKCLRCQRYHCPHVLWVQMKNITLPEEMPPDSPDDCSDLIDE